MNDLQRFLAAQQRDYATALTEIKAGRKRSHWMWYIFPQIAGLGYSEMAKRYGIRDRDEAIAYLAHPVLGKRLIEISQALLTNGSSNATQVMGTPDDIKAAFLNDLVRLTARRRSGLRSGPQKVFPGRKR